jgi:DNA-binding transcriptional ArsR family regulator
MENPRLQNVLHRLDKVTNTGDGWMACCPAHDDRNPSLSIKTAGTKILLHCFAGCSIESIAQAIGLEVKDLHLDEPKAQPNTFYEYQDEQGNLLFQVVRSPQKKFMQRRPGKDGEWINNTRGVRRVPYRLPELLAGVEAGAMIFIPEGEKDVESLRKLGLVATCNPMGAGKWTKELNPYFKGANVVILPDNDEPGREHANKVAQNLQGVAASVKVLELPGLDEKGDVSDWLEAGGTGEQLAVLVHKTPEWKFARLQKHLPEIMTVEQILKTEFPEPIWVVPGLIPAGLTVLAGAPKLGKSWLALCLGLALANGGRALGKIQVDQGDVLYLALEDTPRRIQDRLEQLGATVTKSMAVCTEWERGTLGTDVLDGYLSMNPKIKLVIIDTLQRFREPTKGNQNIYEADYEAMTPIKRVADKHNMAIIVVHHTRKSGGTDGDPFSAISGSQGIGGTVDTRIVLERASGEADGKLYIDGRDVEYQELALKMDNLTGWTLLGEAREYEQNKERSEILEVLRKADGAMRTGEIAEEIGKTGPATSNLLKKLVKEGLIKRAGYGLYIHLVNDESGESDESSKKSVSDETQLNFHLSHGDSPEVSSGAGEAVKVKSPPGGSLKGSFTTFTTYTKEGNKEAAATKVEEIEL